LARHPQSQPTRAHEADADGHFGGRGAWDEIRGAEQIKKLLAREPLAFADDFLFHQRDVRRGSAEADAS
jgi:hypothetical protein